MPLTLESKFFLDLESVMKTLLVNGDVDGAMAIVLKISHVMISSQKDGLRPGRQFLSHLLKSDPVIEVVLQLCCIY